MSACIEDWLCAHDRETDGLRFRLIPTHASGKEMTLQSQKRADCLYRGERHFSVGSVEEIRKSM